MSVSSAIRPLKLLLVGASGVGKDALITQYCYHHFAQPDDAAVEETEGTEVMKGEKAYMVEVFSSPDENIAELAEQFIRDADGILLVYSVTSKHGFSKIKDQYRLINSIRREDDSQPSFWRLGQLPPMPMILAGNNADFNAEREVSTQEGIDLALELGIEFIEVTESEYSPVEILFYDMVKAIKRYKTQLWQTKHGNHSTTSLSATAVIRFKIWKRSWIRAFLGKLRDTVASRSRNALTDAIVKGDEATVRRLIQSNWDVNVADPQGTYPLHLAANDSHENIVRLLLDEGAFVDRVSRLNGTALSAAAVRGNNDIVRILLEAGAGVDVPCDYYGTILQAIARRNNPEIIRHIERQTTGRK